MAKKNINKRCPFAMECGRGKCMFEQKELGCDYYYNNAMDDNVIPDQEERRRLKDEMIEREKEEQLMRTIEVEDYEDKTEVVPARASEIALEIKIIERDAAEFVVRSGIKIGQLLKEVKAGLKHGQWEAWLRENVDYSVTKAQRFMKLADVYAGHLEAGEDDIAEVMASMLPSKAILLAQLAPAQRKEFVQEHDAHEMSVREMQAAIKAKEDAEKRATEAEQTVAAEQQRADAAEEVRASLAEQLEHLKKQLEAAQVPVGISSEERAKIEQEVKAEAEKAAKAKIDAAKKKADKELEKARAEGAEALAKAVAEQEKAVQAATEQAKAEAEKEAQRRYEATIGELQGKLAVVGTPFRIKFGACFEALQAAYGRMEAVVKEAKAEDPEEGKLLESMLNRVSTMLMAAE